MVLTKEARVNGEALPGELIDDAQHPERPAIIGAVGNEVVGPDMVGALWPEADARPVIEPETPALGLFCRDLQSLPPPDPLDPFVVHPPTIGLQQRRDPTVAIPAMAAGKLNNGRRQCRLFIPHRPCLALGRSVLA